MRELVKRAGVQSSSLTVMDLGAGFGASTLGIIDIVPDETIVYPVDVWDGDYAADVRPCCMGLPFAFSAPTHVVCVGVGV